MFKSLIMIFFCVSLAVGGQLLLKSGMNQVGRITDAAFRDGAGTFVKVATNSQVILGLFLYFFSAMVWIVVLSRVDLSFAYPLLGTSYVIILLASQLLFHESVTPVRWSGAFLISLGVLLITRT